jgi:hypothetical protein
MWQLTLAGGIYLTEQSKFRVYSVQLNYLTSLQGPLLKSEVNVFTSSAQNMPRTDCVRTARRWLMLFGAVIRIGCESRTKLLRLCVCVCVCGVFVVCVCVENAEFPNVEPPVTHSTHLAFSVRQMDIRRVNTQGYLQLLRRWL